MLKKAIASLALLAVVCLGVSACTTASGNSSAPAQNTSPAGGGGY